MHGGASAPRRASEARARTPSLCAPRGFSRVAPPPTHRCPRLAVIGVRVCGASEFEKIYPPKRPRSSFPPPPPPPTPKKSPPPRLRCPLHSREQAERRHRAFAIACPASYPLRASCLSLTPVSTAFFSPFPPGAPIQWRSLCCYDGKQCVAIASDLRFGQQQSTIATNFDKCFKCTITCTSPCRARDGYHDRVVGTDVLAELVQDAGGARDQTNVLLQHGLFVFV